MDWERQLLAGMTSGKRLGEVAAQLIADHPEAQADIRRNEAELQKEIDQTVQIIRDALSRVSLDNACAELNRRIPLAVCAAARKLIEDEIRGVKVLTEREVVKDPNRVSWYPGPDGMGRFWKSYQEKLQAKGRSADDLKQLKDSTTGVVSLLSNPTDHQFQTRGLVLGYVQSGKTEHFTDVIAKAADAGYHVFIVLSGLTDKLRQQTAVRLDAELVQPQVDFWRVLTGVGLHDDFQEDFNNNANWNGNGGLRTLCVVKKNAGVLNRLLESIRKVNSAVLQSCPVLIIDDEADQASVNSGDTQRAINRLIRQICSTLTRVSYVGYTATPFANIFIDPTEEMDLYPRHFIWPMPRPKNYFGAEDIFGRDRFSSDESDEATDGLDVIRQIPDEELPFLRPMNRRARNNFALDLNDVPSLKKSICYFWLATAARRVRGQNGHSTMLIHTSQYADVHHQFTLPLEAFRKDWAARLGDAADGQLEALAELREIWKREQWRDTADGKPQLPRVPRDGLMPVEFADLAKHLATVVKKTQLIAENYLAEERDRLAYVPDQPGVFIVVGGNVLSRGLTLEGLVTSYFVRSASAYDTLLQMGRWFGYRIGYADLPRVWMSDELRAYFIDLAGVEHEIRQEIERYRIEKLTPKEFGVRIRTHPSLRITERGKMRTAVETNISYGGTHPQTLLFAHQDAEWLHNNLDAACQLVRSADASNFSERDSFWIASNVSPAAVLNFLATYKFHEDSWNLSRVALTNYINGEMAEGGLTTWTVGIVTQRNDVNGTVDLGLGRRVNMLARTRMKPASMPHANIKSLVSRADMSVDLPLSPAQASAKGWPELMKMKIDERSDNGLLLLYPISRNSRAKEWTDRLDLNAADDVLGVGFAFPESCQPDQARSYLTNGNVRGDLDVEVDTDDLPETPGPRLIG